MAEKRTYEERILEKQQQIERNEKRIEQYKAQVKRLKAKAKEEERKARTHKLIVAGAELAALYNEVLEIESVHMLINFLREQKEQGRFDLTKKEEPMQEVVMEQEEKAKTEDEFFFDSMFDF